MTKDFLAYANGLLKWRTEYIPSEPHQELIPWTQLFRPLAVTNWAWVNAWPEDDYRI